MSVLYFSRLLTFPEFRGMSKKGRNIGKYYILCLQKVQNGSILSLAKEKRLNPDSEPVDNSGIAV